MHISASENYFSQILAFVVVGGYSLQCDPSEYPLDTFCCPKCPSGKIKFCFSQSLLYCLIYQQGQVIVLYSQPAGRTVELETLFSWPCAISPTPTRDSV